MYPLFFRFFSHVGYHRISKSKETENILVVARDWGEAAGLIEMDCVMSVGFPYKKMKMF